MAYSTINISVPKKMKLLIEKEVKTGNFGSTSDFFRDLVRDYLEEKRIEQLIIAGIQDNSTTPLTKQDFIDIKNQLTEHIKRRDGGNEGLQD